MTQEPTGLEPVTPVKITSTSATERAGFRRCRRRWLLTTIHRLESVEGDPSLWLGTLVHSGLEGYYLAVLASQDSRTVAAHDPADAGLDAYQAAYDESLIPLTETLGFLWPSVEPTYRELGELGFDMLTAYFEREKTNPLFDEVVSVERRVNVAIRNPKNGRKVGVLSVRADATGRRSGRLAVADHKTASREMTASQLDLDDQLTAEVFAVWQDGGEFPEEAIYNVLLKKAPRPPKRLKDGKGGVPKLSQDRSQATTYELYVAEIESLGISRLDYADVLDHFYELERSGESQFFRRDHVLRTPAQMTSFEANLFEEWRDMRSVASHPERAYPNPTPMNCPSCPVRLVCTTMSDDGDVEAVIKAQYVIGDPRR